MYEHFHCPHWTLYVVAPAYMEAAVEALKVQDNRNHWFNIPQDRAAGLEQTVGWDKGDWYSGGLSADSAGAPMEIYLRWESLVEPQTYSWTFTVPESIRQKMAQKEWATWQGKTEQFCRHNMVIGVAPGGRTIVWLDGSVLSRVEVARGKAEVEPLGSGQGWGKGYAYPLSDEAKKYIKEHGVPYGSWN
jgi:hypothetical protein